MKRIILPASTACLLALLAFPLKAGGEGLALEDLMRIEQVESVAVSPDGEQIAFIRSVPRNPYADDDGPRKQELHVASGPDQSHAFVTRKADIASIDWSPDGRRITFLATEEETDHVAVFAMPADGGEARVIQRHESSIGDYSWAPDGQRMAFMAAPAADGERESLAEKGFNARVWEEGMDPVEVWIARPGDDDHDPEALDLEGSASGIAWAPQGDQIALMLAPTPLIDEHIMFRKLVIADAATGEIVTEFDHEGKKGDLAWSPDASRLAFVGAVDINDPREGRLMVAEVDSGTYADILPDYDGHIQTMVWDDAESLIYLGHKGVYSELARIGRDGSGRETLVDKGQPVLRTLSWSADRLAFVADAGAHPREVYVLDGAGLERWTDSNPWLDEVRLADQEVVRFQARDGLELEGVLVHPLDGGGQPAPTILAIHGGPEAHDSHGWLTSYAKPAQAAAARGYAMFFPNYRGSTARGVEFSKLGQNDPAGAEFDDLVDARNHLIDIGVAREGQIGITGRSYGGYASAWAATRHSQYYDASVIAVGAGENISKFGTSDITRELYLVHLREWPWDNWAMYTESSPVYYAGESRTPALILHGELDPRVHVSQGMILHRFLKLNGQAPVRLVTYPEEAHATRNAASQRDYSMRLMRWMDHFLVDGADELPDHELDHSDWVNGQ